MSPVFSPDGTRIAYTAVDPQFNWDTWIVPTQGGEPQRWLQNATGLTWSSPRQMLFSEVRNSRGVGLVTAQEGRIDERDVGELLPPDVEKSSGLRRLPFP